MKNAAGDIVMRWDARAGRDTYFHRNISAVHMTVLAEHVVTGAEFNFTYAAQVAAYGYDALFASFELYEYDAARGAVGPKVAWSGNSARAAEPSAGARRPRRQRVTSRWRGMPTVLPPGSSSW